MSETEHNYKNCNIHGLGLLERKERQKGTKDTFGRIMLRIFPKLISDITP
jgi:hypothetical protein